MTTAMYMQKATEIHPPTHTNTHRHTDTHSYSQLTNCCSSWELMLTRWALCS